MSEEEAIKIIKQMYKETQFEESQKRIAIEVILELYIQEKKKNKRLEEKLNYLKATRDCDEEFEL